MNMANVNLGTIIDMRDGTYLMVTKKMSGGSVRGIISGGGLVSVGASALKDKIIVPHEDAMGIAKEHFYG